MADIKTRDTAKGTIRTLDKGTITREKAEKILRQVPAATMKRNYMMFHKMDPVVAIEDLKELSRQKQKTTPARRSFYRRAGCSICLFCIEKPYDNTSYHGKCCDAYNRDQGFSPSA